MASTGLAQPGGRRGEAAERGRKRTACPGAARLPTGRGIGGDAGSNGRGHTAFQPEGLEPRRDRKPDLFLKVERPPVWAACSLAAGTGGPWGAAWRRAGLADPSAAEEAAAGRATTGSARLTGKRRAVLRPRPGATPGRAPSSAEPGENGVRAAAAGVGVNACAHRRESAIRGCPRRRAGVRHGRSGAWSLQAARVRELRAACPRADGDQSVTVTVSLCHCMGCRREPQAGAAFRDVSGDAGWQRPEQLPHAGPPESSSLPWT